ncbi:MAG TPA: hypothetical protein VFU40_03805 [Gemmatimonadales bacterium]|nr:hypothetical protein [Gemmatimonadales bacterium]
MRPTLVAWTIALVPSMASAQSAEFSVRGLGFPGRALAVRSVSSGGAFGLFDPESSQNPASLGGVATLTSTFTVTQGFLRVENPAGSSSVRQSRFPQLMIAGPLRRFPAAVGFSFSNYTSRDFTTASTEMITIRGVPVSVSDTLSSRGGLNDFRVAGAYRIRDRWGVGLGFHILTGSNRLTSTRVFNDPAFLSSRQRSELSFAGVGLSVGLMRQFGENLGIALIARSDGHLNMDRDSARVATVDLPYTFGFGVRVRPGSKLDLAAQAMYRTWSGANSDVLALGGTGAHNTIELAAGGEYVSDPRRPYRRPLRFGAHYATVPFPLIPGGEQGREIGVSAGTGLRFAQQRAGVDLALEHLWRSEGPHKERGFILSLGISVRP